MDLVQRGYTGLEARGDVLWLNPCLPEEITRLRLRIRYRGHSLALDITPGRLAVQCLECGAAPVRIGCKADIREIRGGETVRFGL